MNPGAQPSRPFAVFVNCRRIWAIASIHAEAARLAAIHEAIAERLLPRDGLVYLGNMIGRGRAVVETLNELLAFRRFFIARPGSFVDDLVFLRGSQEEMWQKLVELQFAPDPPRTFRWMLDHGVADTLEGYGIAAQEGIGAMNGGPLAITRWTRRVRERIDAEPGHAAWLTSLKRAAYASGREYLFVNAGIDPSRPLDAQGDSFWWGGRAFFEIDRAYDGFARVVRGFDPQHRGLLETPFTLSVDHGSGFGGKLLAICLDPMRGIVESFEA